MTDPEVRAWRLRIFAVTWFSYAGFYLCRKNFSVLMPLMERELHFSKDDLANAIFGYSLLYAIGQFVMGTLSDRFGGRLVVTAGMFVAGACSVVMTFATDPLSILALQSVNGLAQACGWSGLLKILSAWFEARNRGVVMAWWCTNYALGAFLATTFATFAATSAIGWLPGWQRGAWLPGAALLTLGALFGLLVRNGPLTDAPRPPAAFRLDYIRALAANPAIQAIGGAYFCLKLTRYAFLFWLPTYLTERMGFTPAEAGYGSSVYELGGFAGVVASGYISDKLFGSRRFPVGALLMIALAGACLLPTLAGQLGTWIVVPSIALIGALTFGPDTLMGGAATQDAATPSTAATAAGCVNGTGSIGQFVSPYLVSYLVQRSGWDTLFYLFFAFSLAGGLLLAGKWNYRRQETSPAT